MRFLEAAARIGVFNVRSLLLGVKLVDAVEIDLLESKRGAALVQVGRGLVAQGAVVLLLDLGQELALLDVVTLLKEQSDDLPGDFRRHLHAMVGHDLARCGEHRGGPIGRTLPHDFQQAHVRRRRGRRFERRDLRTQLLPRDIARQAQYEQYQQWDQQRMRARRPLRLAIHRPLLVRNAQAAKLVTQLGACAHAVQFP